MPHASDDFAWTDEAIDRLRALWAEGHSAAEIGRHLGASKNAVIGKVHRLGLPKRPSPIRSGEPKPPRPKRIPAGKPTLPPLRFGPVPTAMRAEPKIAPHREQPVSACKFRQLGTRVQACCWPTGEPGTPGFRFCNIDTVPGRPYCETHCELAFVRPRRNQDTA